MPLDRRTFLVGAPLAAAWPRAFAAIPAALAAYERASGGIVGLCALHVATGAQLAWRATERFVLCSTFKASLAALVLARVDAGQESMDAPVRYRADDLLAYAPVAKAHVVEGALSVGAMCEAAVELSDNTCANLLLARVGGPAALTAFWRRLGDGVSRLDHDEPLLNRTPWGRPEDTTSPAAMAATLHKLVLGDALAPPSRDLLAHWLLNCRTGANRLRAGLPTDWRIGDKTGNNGADAAGDIAVAWPPSGGPVVVCVYTRGGRPTAAQLDALFEDVGRMVGRWVAA